MDIQKMLSLWNFVVSVVPAVHLVSPRAFWERGAGRVHTWGQKGKERWGETPIIFKIS